MKLFIYEHCPFCIRARMIFGLKNLPLETSIIMEADSETPMKMVGRKVVPILQKSDGSYMAESMDIVSYVDQLNEPHLLTNPKLTSWEDWATRASKPMFNLVIPRFTKGNFKELSTIDSRQAFIARQSRNFGDLEKLFDDTGSHVKIVQPFLEEFESIVDERLVNNQSDILVYPLLCSMSIVKDLKFGPKTRLYMELMQNESGVELLFNQSM